MPMLLQLLKHISLPLEKEKLLKHSILNVTFSKKKWWGNIDDSRWTVRIHLEFKFNHCFWARSIGTPAIWPPLICKLYRVDLKDQPVANWRRRSFLTADPCHGMRNMQSMKTYPPKKMNMSPKKGPFPKEKLTVFQLLQGYFSSGFQGRSILDEWKFVPQLIWQTFY